MNRAANEHMLGPISCTSDEFEKPDRLVRTIYGHNYDANAQIRRNS